MNIDLITPGAQHPNVASSYLNIGPVISRQNNYPKALEYYQKRSPPPARWSPGRSSLACSTCTVPFFYSTPLLLALALAPLQEVWMDGCADFAPSRNNACWCTYRDPFFILEVLLAFKVSMSK